MQHSSKCARRVHYFSEEKPYYNETEAHQTADDTITHSHKSYSHIHMYLFSLNMFLKGFTHIIQFAQFLCVSYIVFAVWLCKTLKCFARISHPYTSAEQPIALARIGVLLIYTNKSRDVWLYRYVHIVNTKSKPWKWKRKKIHSQFLTLSQWGSQSVLIDGTINIQKEITVVILESSALYRDQCFR